MKITGNLEIITISINQECLVSALIQMSATVMVTIKPSGVAYIEMAHEFRKIGSHGLNEKMKMIGHHYVCIENHLIGIQGNREQLKKPIPVLIIYENLPSLIASAGHVIESARKLNSQWS